MLEIESAGLTDVGRRRSGNEDAYRVDDALGLYVVSDGMGGHLAGEVASGIVVETLHSHMTQGGGRGPSASDETASVDANRLLAGIVRAHDKIRAISADDSACRGMGATVSAVYHDNGACTVANVGDSPIYLVHHGQIEMVSVLHTVTAEHEALYQGEKSPLDTSFSHVLTRAMGVGEKIVPDLCEIQCFAGDTIVICSDGLSDKLAAWEILEVISGKRPAEACDRLVEMANRRGGEDNITVVILKFVNRGIIGRVLASLKEGIGRMLP